MLPKKNRLNLKTGFSWIASGQRAENSALKLFYRFDENQSPKVGVAVPSAVFKQATDRNKVKRMIFNSLGDIYDQLKDNLNIMVIPKLQISSYSRESLTKLMGDTLKDNQLMK